MSAAPGRRLYIGRLHPDANRLDVVSPAFSPFVASAAGGQSLTGTAYNSRNPSGDNANFVNNGYDA